MNSEFSKEGLRELFDESIERYGNYYRAVTADPKKNLDLEQEGIKRLEQLRWLFERIWVLEEAAELFLQMAFDKVQAGEKVDQQSLKTHASNKEEAEILTESFYYIAWRLLGGILMYRFPKLKNGKKVLGIDNVRNKLIEHPRDTGSGVYINSFAYGGPVGPVVKGVRYTGQENVYKDGGLWVNIKEFLDELILVLREKGY